jgi:hypothetical protein
MEHEFWDGIEKLEFHYYERKRRVYKSTSEEREGDVVNVIFLEATV